MVKKTHQSPSFATRARRREGRDARLRAIWETRVTLLTTGATMNARRETSLVGLTRMRNAEREDWERLLRVVAGLHKYRRSKRSFSRLRYQAELGNESESRRSKRSFTRLRYQAELGNESERVGMDYLGADLIASNVWTSASFCAARVAWPSELAAKSALKLLGPDATTLSAGSPLPKLNVAARHDRIPP